MKRKKASRQIHPNSNRCIFLIIWITFTCELYCIPPCFALFQTGSRTSFFTHNHVIFVDRAYIRIIHGFLNPFAFDGTATARRTNNNNTTPITLNHHGTNSRFLFCCRWWAPHTWWICAAAWKFYSGCCCTTRVMMPIGGFRIWSNAETRKMRGIKIGFNGCKRTKIG